MERKKPITENDLEEMISQERELKSLIAKTQSELAEKRRILAPHQAEKILFRIEDFSRLFKPGGAVYDSFSDIRENLKLLSELDSRAIQKLADDKLYSRGPAVKYIVEQLLVSVLHPRSELWPVLEQIAKTRKIDGCPFVEGHDGET